MRRTLRSLSIAPILIATLSGIPAAARQNAGIPAGTQIQVRLLEQLDTGQAQAGQVFSATVAGPVTMNGRTVLATGSKISGRVIEAVSSGRLKRPASITLELTQAGRSPIATEPLRIDGKSHLLRNVAIIGGESAAGAIIGGAMGGKKGALLGAGIGAGAGTATAYMTGKKEIVLPVETPLTFVVAGSSNVRAANAADGDDSYVAQAAGHASRADQRRATQSPYFSERDRRIIGHYFQDTENLPPGLAKRGGKLPPGLERQLERNGTLPPGLQKRLQPFPDELEEQLPRLPAGYARAILPGRVLILGEDNRVVDLMLIRHGRDQDEDEDRDKKDDKE